MKKLITDYTFDPAARTVTLTGYATVDIRGLIIITNVTDNIIIYSYADMESPYSLGKTTAATNVFTLGYDTTKMSASDNLQIYYDDKTNDGYVGLIDNLGASQGVKFINGKPRVSSMPYLYDIAEGNVTDHTPWSKLGYNGDVGATEEDIITQGGVYPWIAAGAGIALEVVSSSGDDTVAGTGVQKVRVSFLDADYAAKSEIISMNGATPVPLVDTTVLRVNALRATQVGTGGIAAGDITCRLVGGAATVYRTIVTGFTRGRGITYTVPLGKTLYITSITVSSGYTTSGKVVRWIGRAQVDDTAPTVRIPFFQPFFEIITEDASFHEDFEMPVVIPATADLKVSAVSNGAGSFCTCSFRGWIE